MKKFLLIFVGSFLIITNSFAESFLNALVKAYKNNSELKEVADSDLVMETAPDNIGIHVDRISDVIRVEHEELQAVPANMVHPFYKHVVRRGDGFIIILEPAKILNLHETPDLLS